MGIKKDDGTIDTSSEEFLLSFASAVTATPTTDLIIMSRIITHELGDRAKGRVLSPPPPLSAYKRAVN